MEEIKCKCTTEAEASNCAKNCDYSNGRGELSPPKEEPSKTVEELKDRLERLIDTAVEHHATYDRDVIDAIYNLFASQFKQVPSEKRVTDEDIERMAEEYSPYNKYANPIDHELTTKPFIDGFKKALSLSLPSEGKEIETCDYCKRTEPCRGSYPEGCFHPKA